MRQKKLILQNILLSCIDKVALSYYPCFYCSTLFFTKTCLSRHKSLFAQNLRTNLEKCQHQRKKEKIMDLYTTYLYVISGVFLAFFTLVVDLFNSYHDLLKQKKSFYQVGTNLVSLFSNKLRTKKWGWKFVKFKNSQAQLNINSVLQ